MNRHSDIFAASALVALMALAPGPIEAQFGGPPPLTSPELTDGGDVIFRLRAPDAGEVRLTSGGDIPGLPPGPGTALTKGEDGIWTVTLESLEPGAFRYNFLVDAVPTLDPSNRHTSESTRSSWSLFYVPGHAFMDTQRVPHGTVAEVTYWSDTFDLHRRMHVYTPPGYETGSDLYPVFYLLHGAGDSDDSWTTVGRAGFILDNLIAAGDAEPMIVVMPDGHPPVDGPGMGIQFQAFAEEFASDIKPHVESHYRVLDDRAHTAIAGLSMGGMHTLEIAMSDLDEYGYVGVFSSGVFGINENDDWVTAHQATLEDASLRDGLELFWWGIGEEDFLYEMSEATVTMLRDHGFDLTYHESSGGHTWMNWRDYLHAFAPSLFQERVTPPGTPET
jgi:enterochelin esterase-like enzyme